MSDPGSLPPAHPSPPRRARNPWPWVALVLGLALIAAAGALLMLRAIGRVPGAVAEGGREVIRELATVARAFHQGTVTHLFVSYATSVEGATRLQVATLKQTEVWELEESATAFWGALDLPPVAVRATAPVETTYYVDLDDQRWTFTLEGDTVVVHAPPLRFNKPAIDASRIRYQVTKGSLLRDEREVAAQLKRELTGRSGIRARQNVPLVRETARKQVAGFVRTWLLRQFDDAERYRVEVVFAGEEREREERPEVRAPRL